MVEEIKCPYCGGNLITNKVKTQLAGADIEFSYQKCDSCGEEFRE
jgi:transposase-like protein